MEDKNRSSGYKSAERIRVYWRNNPKYEQPDVHFVNGTYEIASNMKDGYPPLKV